MKPNRISDILFYSRKGEGGLVKVKTWPTVLFALSVAMLFLAIAGIMVYSIFLAPVKDPITIQDYRGAGVMGIMLALALTAAMMLGSSIYPLCFPQKPTVKIYRLAWNEAGEKMLARIQEVTGEPELRVILNKAMHVYASLVESRVGHGIIASNVKNGPKDYIQLVVDNTKKPTE